MEYFADVANADFFAEAINDTDNLIMPTISLLEVFKRILQQRDENALCRRLPYEAGAGDSIGRGIAPTAAKLGVENKLQLADPP